MLRRIVRRTPRAFVLLVAVVVTIAPLLWIVSTSVKTEEDLYAYPPILIPAEPTFEWYPFLVSRGFVQAILRSCLVSFMATLIVLGLSGFAAYGFSRYRFKGKELMLLAVLGTQMLPGVINIIPLYQMMISFGLLNTLAAVYLILAAMNVPLAVWMLKGFFDSIPISLDESALVDGASRLYTYFRIIVPLGSPGLVAAGVFTFLFSWNEFIIPLTMTSSSSKRLATVALYLFKTPHETNWAGIASGAVLMMVPVILLYLAFNRYFVTGWRGAVKG
jgi:multiple sugar transport system permease protein